jgi:hypothetical protein
MTKRKQIRTDVRLRITRKIGPQVTPNLNNFMWNYLSLKIWRHLNTALFGAIYRTSD